MAYSLPISGISLYYLHEVKQSRGGRGTKERHKRSSEDNSDGKSECAKESEDKTKEIEESNKKGCTWQ